MAKPKTKYQVRSPLNGEILDTRTSTSCRVYTHAIAVRKSEKYAETEAHRWTVRDVKNAEWSWGNAEKIAAGQGSSWEKVEDAEEILAHGTCMNYVAAQKAKRIASFEERKAAGEFSKLEVVTYCGRPDLAQKEHLKAAKQPWIEAVFTIEVERLA